MLALGARFCQQNFLILPRLSWNKNGFIGICYVGTTTSGVVLWLKLNVDGGLFRDKEYSEVGAVLRDEEGQVLGVIVHRFRSLYEPIVV
ncbi:hypothetical protein SLE2022_333650 [Rubroshorea leprosula]